MADKVYALEVNEDGLPTQSATADGGRLARWVFEALGDAVGDWGMDDFLTDSGGAPAAEGMRAQNVTSLVLTVVGMHALLIDSREQITALETRLAALEGEPPA